ncbi:MAG: hypothetical protein ABNH26_08190 [Celeribacter sp.]|jgi:hypothetical protein
MDRVLHLGLHRTATTTLQDMAKAVAPALATQGVLLLTPEGFGEGAENLRPIVRASLALQPRRGKWRSILRRRTVRRELQERLDTLLSQRAVADAPPTRIVLSEEMMLGPAFGRRGQSFYPQAERHLRALRQVLAAPVDEVHLTLRSYDTFLTSVFAMRAVNAGNVAPFAQIGEQLVEVRSGWPELTDLIRHLMPEARLVLRTYENSTPEMRLRDLIGDALPEIPLERPQQHLHRSPTAEAVEAAIALGRAPEDARAFTAQYADGARFDPLSDTQKMALQRRYETDIGMLRTRPDIDFRQD